MKIRLAILDNDKNYLSRIVSVFTTKYADKFEIYSFTDPEVALDTLENTKIDILLAGESFDIDFSRIPKRCGFAYFVETSGVESLNGHFAICKFQKADFIYKQILSVFADNAENISGKTAGEDAGIISFVSPSGGSGSSTVAAAAALHFAGQGKKTLYLDLEKFGTADSFFSAEGMFDMSDIIFSIKTKKSNLAMKLESSVKQDAGGVYFFSAPQVALDMLELSPEEIIRLINELQLIGSYDIIIIDIDFSLDKSVLDILRLTDEMILVCDGSEISVTKTERAYNALSLREQNEDYPLTNRISVIYNRFNSNSGRMINTEGLRSLGGSPVYREGTSRQIAEQISKLDIFGSIG